MTKIQKTYAGFGVGISALLVIAFGINSLHRPDTSKAPKTTSQTAGPASNAPQQSLSQGSTQPSAAVAVAQLTPLPANATNIPDENLLQLSLMVNLADAKDQAPDKNLWKAIIPAAQKLINGPCDCEQKIWLTHFLEMGDYALSDSLDKYHETARLMATLGRNDEQAMALSKSRAKSQ